MNRGLPLLFKSNEKVCFLVLENLIDVEVEHHFSSVFAAAEMHMLLK